MAWDNTCELQFMEGGMAKRSKTKSVNSTKVREVGSEIWTMLATADFTQMEVMVLIESMAAEVMEHHVPPHLWDSAIGLFSKHVKDMAGDLHLQRSTIH